MVEKKLKKKPGRPKRIKGRHCFDCKTTEGPFRYIYPVPGSTPWTGILVCLGCEPARRQKQIEAGVLIQ